MLLSSYDYCYCYLAFVTGRFPPQSQAVKPLAHSVKLAKVYSKICVVSNKKSSHLKK